MGDSRVEGRGSRAGAGNEGRCFITSPLYFVYIIFIHQLFCCISGFSLSVGGGGNMLPAMIVVTIRIYKIVVIEREIKLFLLS